MELRFSPPEDTDTSRRSRVVEGEVGLVSLILITGAESVLVDREITRLVNAATNSEVTRLDGSDMEVGAFADATAPSLFSEARILVVRDLQDLTQDCYEEIERYLQSPDPSLTVIFTFKGGVKGKGLIDKIKKARAEVIECEPLKKESEKLDFVRREFVRLDRKITSDAVQALVDALGSDVRELTAACSQLAFDTPISAKAITIDHVNAFYQGRVETTGFDVADATMEGNPQRALIALRQALSTGTEPVMIVSALASSIRTIAKVSGVPRGVKSFEVAGELGLAPWQIDKARRQLSRWTPAGIAFAVKEVANADLAVKGAAADPIYALERAVMAIASALKNSSLSRG